MPDLTRFRALSDREKILVSVAVLLDGHDAVAYLSGDKERKIALTRAAQDLAELSPEVRLPLVGTLIREALSKLENEKPSDCVSN